jgi:hypothetical protein
MGRGVGLRSRATIAREALVLDIGKGSGFNPAIILDMDGGEDKAKKVFGIFHSASRVLAYGLLLATAVWMFIAD